MTIIIYFNKYSMPSHILGISVFSVIWFPCGFNIVIYMDNALTPVLFACVGFMQTKNYCTAIFSYLTVVCFLLVLLAWLLNVPCQVFECTWEHMEWLQWSLKHWMIPSTIRYFKISEVLKHYWKVMFVWLLKHTFIEYSYARILIIELFAEYIDQYHALIIFSWRFCCFS
jgi:hypothetical protein